MKTFACAWPVMHITNRCFSSTVEATVCLRKFQAETEAEVRMIAYEDALESSGNPRLQLDDIKIMQI